MKRWTALLVLAAVAAGGALAAGSRAPAPGTARGCPLKHRAAVRSHRAGADSALVPSGTEAVLICSYSGFSQPAPLVDQGPPHRLIADRLLAGSIVSRIAADLNAIPPRTGAYSCPADLGNQIVAYFRYGSGADDPVNIQLGGCNPISNGQVNRLGLNAPVVGELASLAQPATITGRLRLCGGPAPGGCRTQSFGACGPGPHSCFTADRVAIFTAGGRRLVTVRLHRARFSAYVPAGRYELELLGDGRHVHGKVLQRARARARAGRTTSVIFGVSVP